MIGGPSIDLDLDLEVLFVRSRSHQAEANWNLHRSFIAHNRRFGPFYCDFHPIVSSQGLSFSSTMTKANEDNQQLDNIVIIDTQTPPAS